MIRTFVLRDPLHKNSLFSFIESNWQALARQETPMQVVVTEWRAKRSSDQNRRYWAILNEIAQAAWLDGRQYAADVWAEFFKRRLIGEEELPGGGSVGISTTTLDVAEFTSYMDKIEAYAVSELGVQFGIAA
jgi:hypothetical protein